MLENKGRSKIFFLSVVIPVYNEEVLIKKSLFEIKRVLDKNKYNYEIIIVDDGSLDATWAELKSLFSSIVNLKAVRLSRNFGKEAAICAGLDKTQGDVVVVMDADLQHPPTLIPKMVKLWLSGYDIVDGIKRNHDRGRFLANIFYSIFYKFVGIDLRNASDFKLLDSKVVQAWKRMPEKKTFFRAMSVWVGFRRINVFFSVPKRCLGRTKWSVFSLFKLALEAITSFSALPLQLVTLLGWLFLFGAIILGIQTIYMKLRGFALDGFTTVILLILITGSLLMISLGIIGFYIAKIYEEIKQRPRYIIAEVLNNKK